MKKATDLGDFLPQIRLNQSKMFQFMVKIAGMDKIDAQLIHAVQRDGRQTLAQLSDLCATSASSVARRLKRLEDQGVITGYSASVSPKGLGFKQDIFVEVTLQGQDGGSMAAFEQAIAGVRQVLSCWLMSGEFDYLVRVVARDASDYEQLHRHLSQLPGVQRLRSSFALRQVLWRQIQVG
jgi:Lrp/AsnC family transcriptional regulator, leucine-responsive regulatory protein